MKMISDCYRCQDLAEFTTFPGNPYIKSPIIRWHIADIEGTPDLEKHKVIEAFRAAFGLWQPSFHPIRFESTSVKQRANITLHFANDGDRDLPSPFGQGVLAYAYAPRNNKSQIWFNDRWNWAEMHSIGSVNLKKVTVHELGHSFGISHSLVLEDIMAPRYTPNNDINITQDSIDAVNFLYGDFKKEIENRKPPEPKPDPDPQPEPDKVLVFLRKMYPRYRSLLWIRKWQALLIAEELGLEFTKYSSKYSILQAIEKELRSG